VIFVGKPQSGKTRMVWQLLQEHPEALVIIPRRAVPPESFEASSFAKVRQAEAGRLHDGTAAQQRLRHQAPGAIHCLCACPDDRRREWRRAEQRRSDEP
jgi:hypothetical protein